jgi:hypothetical protein
MTGIPQEVHGHIEAQHPPWMSHVACIADTPARDTGSGQHAGERLG